MRSEDPPLVIDVREDAERAAATIPGTVHIPMRQLSGRLTELPEATPLVFVCHHGARSRQAAEWAAAHGRADVANLAGGIDGWSLQIDPTIPRY